MAVVVAIRQVTAEYVDHIFPKMELLVCPNVLPTLLIGPVLLTLTKSPDDPVQILKNKIEPIKE